MNKIFRIFSIIMLIAMVGFIIAYYITGKFLSVSLVCLIAFLGFGIGAKKARL